MGTVNIATIHDYLYQVPNNTAYNEETENRGEHFAKSANGSPNLTQNECMPRATWKGVWRKHQFGCNILTRIKVTNLISQLVNNHFLATIPFKPGYKIVDSIRVVNSSFAKVYVLIEINLLLQSLKIKGP